MSNEELLAFAEGYYDGRAEGIECVGAYHSNGELRHLYRRGYDAGVAAYAEVYGEEDE
jgi:hypothetical protein